MLSAATQRHALGSALLIALFTTYGCRDADGMASSTSSPATATATQPTQRVAVTVTAGGYQPSVVHLKQGQPAIIAFTRVVDSECLQAVRMPWMSEALPLPKGETVEVPVDTAVDGTFSYSCWMSMVFGRVVIDPADAP